MNHPSHPAAFSEAVLDVGADLIPHGTDTILDVLAGIGKVADLKKRGVNATFMAIELQPKWAVQAAARGCKTVVADSQSMPLASASIPLVFSSPVYGNRLSDHHDARDDSDRITYRHKYGEELHPANAGQMYFWQEQYKVLHRNIITEIWRVLRHGKTCIWNTKDFYQTKYPRSGKVQIRHEVTRWFIETFLDSGFALIDRVQVSTPGMRKGRNRNVRVPYDDVCIFRKG